MKKGKFIVIDGIDGTGKATQTALLAARLRKEGIKVKPVSFPNYYENFFGKLIGEYLSGKYGDFIEVDPHIASVLYAADRFESSQRIRKWLDEGFTIVADRYVSANQIHQGGKIDDEEDRIKFLKWLDDMEYGVFKIPRPDVIAYLHLPVALSQKLLKAKVKQLALKKRYLEGKKDVAEDNLIHMEASQESALSIIKKSNNWFKIECDNNGEVRSREEIHAMIYSKVRKLLGLSDKREAKKTSVKLSSHK